LAEKYALGENKYFGYYNRSSAYGDDLLSLFIMEIEILRDCLKKKILHFPQIYQKIKY
jgi:hypothetical protein